MKKHGVKRLIFSSSATVYGLPKSNDMVGEETQLMPCTNPYGRTKRMCEQIIEDLCRAEEGWMVCNLRYFNPVGAHPSSVIGEDPTGIPANLMPFVSQVAAGQILRELIAKGHSSSSLTRREMELLERKQLFVYGNDYDTRDGTGVRDFIHVVDLSLGHVAALKTVLLHEKPWWRLVDNEERYAGVFRTYNLGTGRGYSVLEVVREFMNVNHVAVPFQFAERRPGDVPQLVADPSRVKRELGFVCKRGLPEMCVDMWNWQMKDLRSTPSLKN